MITDEKIASIKKRLKNGEPVGEIKAGLDAEGYTKEDIEACFPAHTYDMSGWYLLFGSILLLWGIIVFMGSGNIFLLICGGALLVLYYEAKKKKDKKKADDIVSDIGSDL
ncbi:hypothetical protein [Ferruginibacter sp. HRS2-29]|uniref:hypothetical protein n=1 Tax=Ferruginibacter sp. HRS2-29 TaxID=2487334 RepID=UPI0020CD1563|nr:hypothetical protein [Ferruginibacter sp. HRS2-29]MCP9751796.1 hypothetical protein [Ferruginibacter sp. HRS2-29]